MADEATITTGGSGIVGVTIVNVFEVDPSRQAELIALLAAATDEVMRYQSGFVSASIHAAIDGTRVLNYAQWESVEHFRAMLADPEAVRHMTPINALAAPNFHLYEVAHIRRR